MSKDLLVILGDKANYDRYGSYVKEHTVTKEEGQVLKDLPEFQATHGDVDWQEFKEWFKLVKHPMYKQEKIQVFDALFDNLDTHTPTVVTESIIEKYIGQDYCTRISEITLKGTDGEDVDLTEVTQLVEEYNNELGLATKMEAFVNTESIADIISRQQTEGLDWPLKFLNKSIGLLPKGRLIVLGARPNVGKTTFLGNCAKHFLPQIKDDRPIVWLNNEEEEGSIKKRIVQCGIHWLGSDIDADPKGAVEAFEKQCGSLDRIVVVNAVTFNRQMCEEIFKHYKPAAIIIDQLRKVRGAEKRTASEVERLEHTYQWAREMAKIYAPVITVHQLKTEAEGASYPDMSMLYGSGTAIQGEADTIIMLGRNYSDPDPNTRYISIVKTKEAFGPDVDPSLSEGKDILVLAPSLAKFEE